MLSRFSRHVVQPAKASRAISTSAPRLYYNPRPQEEDSRPVVPKYWTGTSAVAEKEFHVNCKGVDWTKIFIPNAETNAIDPDLDHPLAKELTAEMQEKYDKVGAIHLKNTGLTSFNEMAAARRLLNLPSMKYEGGANLREQLSQESNVYDTGAPRAAHLHYHHEMAYVQESPQTLSLMCLHGCWDPKNGATFLSENVGATQELMATKFGEKLKDKGLCYIRKLPDRKYFIDNNLDTSIVYNYWQTSFFSEDPDEAAEMARKKGLEIEWEDSPIFGRYMVTKFYASCFEYDPKRNMNTLFASCADDYMWFDKWPGVMDLPHWERPLKLNFGDDEVMTREEKQLFTDVYDHHGIPVYWEKGDVAIMCNWKFAHGRPEYAIDVANGEQRELGVILGETFKRVGDLPDKWNHNEVPPL